MIPLATAPVAHTVTSLTPKPGDYGCSHGSGMVGELIRHATDSWAGHAFVYIGNHMIIEAAPPATRISPVSSHPDAVYNTDEPKTDQQRGLIIARAHALLGTPYDYPAYIAFAMMCLKLRTEQQVDPLFVHDHWRVCSADVADEYAHAGIDVRAGMDGHPLARLVAGAVLAGQAPASLVPNLIAPALLYDRIAQRPWERTA